MINSSSINSDIFFFSFILVEKYFGLSNKIKFPFFVKFIFLFSLLDISSHAFNVLFLNIRYLYSKLKKRGIFIFSLVIHEFSSFFILINLIAFSGCHFPKASMLPKILTSSDNSELYKYLN